MNDVEKAIEQLKLLFDYNVFSLETESVRLAISALTEQLQQESNKTLTLEGLKQMNDPVWFTDKDGKHGTWGLIKIDRDGNYIVRAAYNTTRSEDDYGKTWLAYRKKVE